MWRGIFKRALSVIPTILAGITVCFFIISLAPGDPAARFITPTQSPEIQQIIRERFGLDRPILFQYTHWLNRVVFHMDFGYSFYNGRPCVDILRQAFIPTFILSFWALVFALIVGISTGIWAAVRAEKRLDRTLSGIMMLFISIPAFWLGLLLLGVFSVRLGWLPGSHLHSLYYARLSYFEKWIDTAGHLIMPVTALGLPLSATIFKYVRAEMISVLKSDCILAARAHGINTSKILWKYALKTSMMPIISLLGVLIPALLSGAVIIEVLFALPGIGRILVTAVFSRDYPVLMAGTTLSFALVIFFNMLADITYTIIDPRIRSGTQ